MNSSSERSALAAYEAHKVVRELRKMIRINRLLREAEAMNGLWLGSEHLLPGDELYISIDGSTIEGVKVTPSKTIQARLYTGCRGELDVHYDAQDEGSWQNRHINLTSVDYDAPSRSELDFRGKESFIKLGGTVVVDTLGLGFRPSTTQILPARFDGLTVNKAVFF